MHRVIELLQRKPLVLHVWSRDKAESEVLPDEHAMISITDRKEEAALPACCQRKMLLRISFPDAERPIEGHELFSSSDANKILDFVAQVVEAGHRVLVVHCEAGISRSAAVAAALATIADESPFRFWQGFIPNPRIFNLLLRAAVLDSGTWFADAQLKKQG